MPGFGLAFICLAAAHFAMAASAAPAGTSTGEDIPEREGELFSEGITLATLYDVARKAYLLYPDAPLAAEVSLNPEMRVAIIDSGILHAHPQISGLVVAERDWTGEGVEDRQGHGTMVALGVLYGRGLAGAKQALPPDAAQKVPGLVIAKVAPVSKPLRLRDVIEAIHWAAAQKARVVNLSLGFRGAAKDFTALQKAIERYPDILFFAAAGNYGPRIPVFPAALSAPNLMAVAEASPDSGRGAIVAPTTFRPVTAEQHATLRREAEQFSAAMRAATEGRAKEARQQLQAIAVAAGHSRAAEAWIQLGLYAVADQDPAAALRHFAESQKITPATAALRELIGSVYFNQGDFPAAEENLRASVALDADQAGVRYLLGLALLRQKKYRAALEQFEATHRLDPNHPDLAPILRDLRAAGARGQLPPQ